MKEVTPHLSAFKQNRLEELQKKLAATTPSTKSRNRPAPKEEGDTASLGKGMGATSREQIVSDIDDIVASECAYCGELMIKSIDKPFIDPQKFEQDKSSWLWRHWYGNIKTNCIFMSVLRTRKPIKTDSCLLVVPILMHRILILLSVCEPDGKPLHFVQKYLMSNCHEQTVLFKTV